jgi:hypothetical protein
MGELFMRKTDWREKVSECRASGLSATDWCKEHGIKYSLYVNWATRYNREKRSPEPQPQWAEVTSYKYDERQDTQEIKLQCGKWTIAVSNGVNPALLLEVLKAVNVVC